MAVGLAVKYAIMADRVDLTGLYKHAIEGYRADVLPDAIVFNHDIHVSRRASGMLYPMPPREPSESLAEAFPKGRRFDAGKPLVGH